VETWLRLAGLVYKNVDKKMELRSKKGQLPIVQLNGKDIEQVDGIKKLGHQFEKDLDAGLNNHQKIVSYAMTSMIENHLFWVLAWWRTSDSDNVIKGYRINMQHVLGSKIPNAILNFHFRFLYVPLQAKIVKARGMGQYKPNEIMEFGRNDLKVLSDTLADKPFFFGDEPATLDIVAFATLAQIYFIDQEVKFPVRDYMQESCPNLVGHVNRTKEMCFPDWDDICKTGSLPKPPPEGKYNKEEKKKRKKLTMRLKMSEKEDKEVGKNYKVRYSNYKIRNISIN